MNGRECAALPGSSDLHEEGAGDGGAPNRDLLCVVRGRVFASWPVSCTVSATWQTDTATDLKTLSRPMFLEYPLLGLGLFDFSVG